jgi:hypothetical protein
MKRKAPSGSAKAKDESGIPPTPASFFKTAVMGKYYRQYAASRRIATLSPEVAAEFRTDDEVNEALLLVKQIRSIGKPRRRKSA